MQGASLILWSSRISLEKSIKRALTPPNQPDMPSIEGFQADRQCSTALGEASSAGNIMLHLCHSGQPDPALAVGSELFLWSSQPRTTHAALLDETRPETRNAL